MEPIHNPVEHPKQLQHSFDKIENFIRAVLKTKQIL